MSVIDLKDRVRERDGRKCVDCGMTNDEHVEKTGRILDVHRLEPGAEYTEEGTVTVCRSCHDKRHEELGRGCDPTATVRVRSDVATMIADICLAEGVTSRSILDPILMATIPDRFREAVATNAAEAAELLAALDEA